MSHWALFLLIILCYSLLSPLIRGQSKIGSGTNGICTHTVGWTTLGCKVREGTTQSKLRVLNDKVSLWVISSAKQQGERNTPEMRTCLFDLSWVLISKEEFADANSRAAHSDLTLSSHTGGARVERRGGGMERNSARAGEEMQKLINIKGSSWWNKLNSSSSFHYSIYYNK